MNLIDIYAKCENMKDVMDNLTRCSLCCAFLNCHVIRVMSKKHYWNYWRQKKIHNMRVHNQILLHSWHSKCLVLQKLKTMRLAFIYKSIKTISTLMYMLMRIAFSSYSLWNVNKCRMHGVFNKVTSHNVVLWNVTNMSVSQLFNYDYLIINL